MLGRHRKKLSLVAVILVLVALLAAPAMAASEQGSRSCPTSWSVGVASETTGLTTHYAPIGSVIGVYNNGIVLQMRYSLSGLQSTSWKASTNGYMNYYLTYAYCY